MVECHVIRDIGRNDLRRRAWRWWLVAGRPVAGGRVAGWSWLDVRGRMLRSAEAMRASTGGALVSSLCRAGLPLIRGTASMIATRPFQGACR